MAARKTATGPDLEEDYEWVYEDEDGNVVPAPVASGPAYAVAGGPPPQGPGWGYDPRQYQQPAPRGTNWGGIIVALIIAGLVGFIVHTVFGQGGKPLPDRNTVPVLSAAIGDALAASPDLATHAGYLAGVCTGAADILQADGMTAEPVFDTRAEAYALVGNVGSLAVAGSELASYPALQTVVADALALPPAPGTTETEGGPLTPADRTALVTAWRNLATAFHSHAE